MKGHGRKEPQIFFTRRAQRLARLLADSSYDESEDVVGRFLELTLRKPMYLEDNGNCLMLQSEPVLGVNQQVVEILRGYLVDVFARILYGSANDFIALHKDRPMRELPRSNLEEGADEAMTKIEAMGDPVMRKHYFQTDERYKGATIVPFSEIKDYRIIA